VTRLELRPATTARITSTTGRTDVAVPEIDTVLVKTASRCNLNCTYCYVYNLGDDGWKSQPRRMSSKVLQGVIDQVGELSHSQDQALSVVLHGGEPLLLGFEGIRRLVGGLKTSLRQDAGLHIQTNAVLLSDEFIDLFASNDVGISISLDGPAAVHDLNRVDRHGRGSYDRVTTAIARLLAHPSGDRLLTGLLAVIDPDSDPVEVYESLKATGAPSFDFLYRDGNYAHLPFGKAQPESTEFGSWMVRLLEHYLTDPSPPRIRVIDDIIRLVLGGSGQKEGVGLNEYGILVIDTDGKITRNDTLKGAYSGGDRFVSEPSIVDGELRDYLSSPEFVEYFDLQLPTSPICSACPELGVCGGGMPAHRWSEERGYANPTVFCADQRMLISKVRTRLPTTLGGTPFREVLDQQVSP
jgi:uncharacterized protein